MTTCSKCTPVFDPVDLHQQKTRKMNVHYVSNHCWRISRISTACSKEKYGDKIVITCVLLFPYAYNHGNSQRQASNYLWYSFKEIVLQVFEVCHWVTCKVNGTHRKNSNTCNTISLKLYHILSPYFILQPAVEIQLFLQRLLVI